MLKLTVVRHAKSAWDDPTVSDFGRTLNKRGQRDAPLMGDRIKASGVLPDCIVTSPAVRALETAEMLCAKIGQSANSIKQEPQIYEASLANLQSVIEAVPDSCSHLMMVGHNPGLESLCNYTDPGSVATLTTCNVVQYALKISHWHEFDRGCGTLVSHWTPKD